MLHPVLRKQIRDPEVLLLYERGKKLTNYSIASEVFREARRIRSKHTETIMDPMLLKASMYPAIGMWARAKSFELSQYVFQNNIIPNTDLGRWRSIEFELNFTSKQNHDDFATFIRLNKWSKSVHIKMDGSVHPNVGMINHIPREVVISYKTGDENMVRDICAFLKDKAYANSTCGTHVHFDMRGLDVGEVRRRGNRLAKAVPALRKLLPSERRDSHYCSQDINQIPGYGYHTNRYAFVNLHAYPKHGTIEVRAHAGTIDADKILNWIKLCDTIMTTCVRTKQEKFETVEDLIRHFDLDEGMIQYIAKRKVRYAAPNYNVEDTPVAA